MDDDTWPCVSRSRSKITKYEANRTTMVRFFFLFSLLNLGVVELEDE